MITSGGTTTLGLYDNASEIRKKADITYVDSRVGDFQAQVVSVAGGHKAYTTLVLAQAAQSSLPANTIVEVTNDGANNGTYQWNGTTLTKSAYDPLTQAKNYTDGVILNIPVTVLEDSFAPMWLVSADVDNKGDIISFVRNNGRRVDGTSNSGSSSLSKSQISIRKIAQNILKPKPTALTEAVTIGTPQSTVISGYPKSWNYITNPECFRAFGGEVYYPVNGSVSTAAAIRARPAYTAGGGVNRGGFEFLTDAPELVVHTSYTSANRSYHVYVDDVYVGTQVGTSGEHNYWKLTFASRKTRKVALCLDTANYNGFFGVLTDSFSRVWATKADGVRVVWNGDSYCEGALVGSGNGWIESYMHKVSRNLGFSDAWNVAMGGTGLLQKGPSGDRPNYRERITDVIAAKPDLLVFNLTVNDSEKVASELATEITEYVRALRSALPEVWIIVHGVAAASLGPTQNVIDGENACKAALAALDDSKLHFIHVSTDPEGPWIFGTGYGNATNSTGNSDIYVGASGSTDYTHLNKEGYAYLTARLTEKFAQKLLEWSNQ